MPEAARVTSPEGNGVRVNAQVRERTPVVIEEEVCEVPTEAVADDDPLDGEVLAIRRERVRGHLPARRPQAIGDVKQCERPVDILAQLPGERRNPTVAAIDDLERAELGDLPGEVAGRPVCGLVDPAIPLCYNRPIL